MKIINFNEKYEKKIVLCLGYFDSIHRGHKSLFYKAKEIAKGNNLEVAVLCFDNDKLKNQNYTGDVFTFKERIIRLSKESIDLAIVVNFDDEFRRISYCDFLESLLQYNIDTLICGFDFKYGYNREGNSELLSKFCKNKNINCIICEKIEDNGHKISTSLIKELLLKGEIRKANEYLGDNYFISGTVVKGKQLGRNIGFPTANIKLDDNKMKIKSGVYLTCSSIGGKIYNGISNVGGQPTFNGKEIIFETYFKDFTGNIYDKYLIVYFIDYIREIQKFNCVNELINQLEKDKEILND